MKLTIYPSKFSGGVTPPPSKSLTHRYMIAGALANGKSVINNMLESKDTQATQKALQQFGVKVVGNQIFGGIAITKSVTVDVNESGSTLRFLIPILSLGSEEITFIGGGQITKRPLSVYEKLYQEKELLYNRLTVNELPLIVRGPLIPGTYHVAGDVSSQFITGLLFALPTLLGDSKIVITKRLESRPYVDLTIAVLKHFEIKVIFDEFRNEIYIPGHQIYQPTDVTIETDYSQGAFFLAAGVLNGSIIVKGLNLFSLQGDKNIIDYIGNLGGNLEVHESHVTALKSSLVGSNIDLKDTPDLGPILMVLAALAEGKTVLQNTARLKIKESDRVMAMKEELSKLGAKIEVFENEVIIEGVKSFVGGVELKCHNDHRIAMSLAIAGAMCDKPVVLIGSDCIEKSYPNFYEDFKKLGGVVNYE